MTLQDKMVQYRAKHNLTQTQLAERVGVSLQTINTIENGIQSPSKITRAKILLVIDEEKGDEK